MTVVPNCGCHDDDLGLLAWHWDADRRVKAGERQVFCKVCERWRWPEFVGPNARTITARQWSKEYGKP
jgi:hypothetical protein